MSQVLGYLLLAAIVAFWTFRKYWQIRYERACHQRERFAGLRLVISRSGAPRRRQVLPFLRPITNHQLTTPHPKG